MSFKSCVEELHSRSAGALIEWNKVAGISLTSFKLAVKVTRQRGNNGPKISSTPATWTEGSPGCNTHPSSVNQYKMFVQSTDA